MKQVIDAQLIERLVAAQFPHWAGLPIRPVEESGWDNRSFRLGDKLLVRLPSAAAYSAQVEKEQRWLPKLAPSLPLAVPEPVALGQASEDYSLPWSIYYWIEGEAASAGLIGDQELFAHDAAAFLRALQCVDPSDGPSPGRHNFFRGGDLAAVYASQTEQALSALGDEFDADALMAIWRRALMSQWRKPPVWLHGDFAPANLLLRKDRLVAVIDFGNLAVGDPACDLALAWTTLTPDARAVFAKVLDLDAETWERGRGWALWKALILFTGLAKGSPREQSRSGEVLQAILDDARGG